MLLGPQQLAGCDGSTDQLVTAIEDQVRRAGLEWPK